MYINHKFWFCEGAKWLKLHFSLTWVYRDPIIASSTLHSINFRSVVYFKPAFFFHSTKQELGPTDFIQLVFAVQIRWNVGLISYRTVNSDGHIGWVAILFDLNFNGDLNRSCVRIGDQEIEIVNPYLGNLACILVQNLNGSWFYNLVHECAYELEFSIFYGKKLWVSSTSTLHL